MDCPTDHLDEIYDDASTNEGLEPWKDSPSEIALHDYRDFLGRREYQRAFVDFFEDQLVLMGYDWREVVSKFLFEAGSKGRVNALPMFNCLVAGLGHPLIHLGYAYELNSKDIAMEALGLVATCYDPHLGSLLERHSSNSANPMTASTSNSFEVLARVHGDDRLNAVFKGPGDGNLQRLLHDDRLMSILLEHWNSWKITNPTEAFRQSQRLAAGILISTAPSLGGHGYDFFLLHLLTTSHAVRILIPFMPTQYHLSLLNEWFLITVAIYVTQLRPLVSEKHVLDYDLDGRDWKWVDQQAVGGKHKLDAHYVKGCRALKEAANVWGDQDQYFLKAAVKFAGEFEHWAGFGS